LKVLIHGAPTTEGSTPRPRKKRRKKRGEMKKGLNRERRGEKTEREENEGNLLAP